jgi:flagellar hook-basal body complex protein FliE
MTAIEPIGAVQATPAALQNFTSTLLGGPSMASNLNFGDMLTKGVGQVEAKLETANALVRRFAIDDSIPVHQVTIALEEARLAVEMAVQVRNKVVEGYREIMNMQL